MLLEICFFFFSLSEDSATVITSIEPHNLHHRWHKYPYVATVDFKSPISHNTIQFLVSIIWNVWSQVSLLDVRKDHLQDLLFTFMLTSFYNSTFKASNCLLPTCTVDKYDLASSTIDDFSRLNYYLPNSVLWSI